MRCASPGPRRAEPPGAFYFRLQGPRTLIEVDNTTDGDHVHAVWHDSEGDFGDDLLAAHLPREHTASRSGSADDARREAPRRRDLRGRPAPRAVRASARARRRCAGTREPAGPGFWALTKHADVLAVSRDSATFSSARAGYMTAGHGPARWCRAV